jgi:hypothetical protein
MLSEDDIGRIAHRVVVGYAPIALGTFGTYALGRPKPTSDLDLFMIKDTVESPAARRRLIQRLLFDVLYPIDAHVFTPEEFEASAYHENSFTWVVARQARLYHWSVTAARRVPSLLPRVPETPATPVVR